MTRMPWLPDSHHVRALQLLEAAPKPFTPPQPGPCGIKWCLASADKQSGWLIEGPRRVGVEPAIHPYRCQVHRKHPDYRPHIRKVNLAGIWQRVDRPARRRKAA
jgi:hypothetical protein